MKDKYSIEYSEDDEDDVSCYLMEGRRVIESFSREEDAVKMEFILNQEHDLWEKEKSSEVETDKHFDNEIWIRHRIKDETFRVFDSKTLLLQDIEEGDLIYTVKEFFRAKRGEMYLNKIKQEHFRINEHNCA